MERRQEDKAIDQLRISRVILPIIMGLLVVGYLLVRQFDLEEFRAIHWNWRLVSFCGAAVLIFLLRHLAYSYRLHLLSERFFSFRKSMKLIVIWEFSSAVSPSSVGGALVALFALSKENYPGGKTAALVVYTIVQDTIFFLVSLPLLFFLIGPMIIRPGITDFASMDQYGLWFLISYTIMIVYGGTLSYGLFVSPHRFKQFLAWLTKFSWTRRFRAKAVEIGRDIVTASNEYRSKPWSLHLKSFLATMVAWSTRFLTVALLIFGFVEDLDFSGYNLAFLYGRLQAMFSIILFIPTPGGAGVVEYLFGGFLSDFVPSGIAPIVAGIWRLLTYYSYLLLGVLIIPGWLRKVMRRG